jgi:hypothetical protein
VNKPAEISHRKQFRQVVALRKKYFELAIFICVPFQQSPFYYTLTPMEHFEFNIEHRGETKTFHGTFGKYGYSYRFIVDVDGSEVIFEPDEERNLRAVVTSGMHNDSKMRELVAIIGQELQKSLISE